MSENANKKRCTIDDALKAANLGEYINSDINFEDSNFKDANELNQEDINQEQNNNINFNKKHIPRKSRWDNEIAPLDLNNLYGRVRDILKIAKEKKEQEVNEYMIPNPPSNPPPMNYSDFGNSNINPLGGVGNVGMSLLPGGNTQRPAFINNSFQNQRFGGFLGPYQSSLSIANQNQGSLNNGMLAGNGNWANRGWINNTMSNPNNNMHNNQNPNIMQGQQMAPDINRPSPLE